MAGNGRKLLSLSVGRFYTQTPQNLVNTDLQENWTGASNALDFDLHANSLGFLNSFGFLTTTEARCRFLGQIGFTVDPAKGPYCFSLGSIRPGELWQIHDDPRLGIDIDIEPYHRDEVVVGFEWQFGRNWIFDAKGIYWRLDNLIGSTLQRDADFGIFRLVENYDDYASILRQLNWVDNFVDNGIGTRERANEILDGFQDDNRSYRALQLQLNKRFSNKMGLVQQRHLRPSQGQDLRQPFRQPPRRLRQEPRVPGRRHAESTRSTASSGTWGRTAPSPCASSSASRCRRSTATASCRSVAT